MRYIKSYSIFESSGLTKSELIQKLDNLSSGLYTYIKDYNIRTKMNHNLHFTYANIETIKLMALVTDGILTSYKLNPNSPDGLIRFICDEWIKIKNRFAGRDFLDINSGKDLNLGNYQRMLWYEYYKVGKQIEDMIKGTQWEIPESQKLQDADIDFITDTAISEYDTYRNFSVEKYWDGTKVKISLADSDISGRPGVEYVSRKYSSMLYESDFIKRLDSYFGGIVILDMLRDHRYVGQIQSDLNVVLYLPFFKR